MNEIYYLELCAGLRSEDIYVCVGPVWCWGRRGRGGKTDDLNVYLNVHGRGDSFMYVSVSMCINIKMLTQSKTDF